MMMALELLGAVLVAVIGVRIAARTSFGRPPWNPGPFWIHVYLEVPVFILPAVVLAPIEFVRDLWIFADVPDSTVYVGIWLIYYALIGYFLAIFAVDRLILRLAGRFRPAQYPRSNTNLLLCAVLIGQLSALAILMVTLKQVPLLSLLSGGEDVGELRKEATIEFAGPAAILSMARLYGFLGFLLAASRGPQRTGPALRAAVIAGSALCLTWSGEKSPLVLGLLAYWFLSRWQTGGQINLRQTVLVALAAGGLALGLIVLTTGESGAAAATIFAVRTFVGQTSGLFQTLANVTPDPKYYLSWIPFAGSIIPEIPTFARDLMIMTEGDTATGGTLNTLFLAEAYGAGGWPMLLVSPFLVGVSLAVGLHVIRAFGSRLGGREFGTCGTFLFLMNSWLTSGMASIVGFRGLIFTCFILLTVGAPYRLLLALGRPPVRERDVAL